MNSEKPKDDLCKHNICEKCHKEIRQQTAQEIANSLDSVEIYHKIGKVKIWRLSNDGVVDEVVDFIKEYIKQKYLNKGDEK